MQDQSIGQLRAQARVVGYIQLHPGATSRDIEADLGTVVFDHFKDDIPISKVEYRGGGWYPKAPQLLQNQQPQLTEIGPAEAVKLLAARGPRPRNREESWHIMDEAARYSSMTQAELRFATNLAHAQLCLSCEARCPSEAWARASFLANYESLYRSSLWRLNRDLGRPDREYGSSPQDAALKDLMLISALEAVREHEEQGS